jgi:tetratricopeptide (TPR) repeat protein
MAANAHDEKIGGALVSALALLVSLSFPAAACAEVRVWQGTLTLPVTVEGPPDPNPPFDIFAFGRFNYPYTLRENLTSQRKEAAWRALFLENEYLKCSVLPDLGGHLYTCIDKISGQPMFYANPSIKKAQIGYRGAWAALGIEFNFPVSHNWVSMSPVDFSMARNPDGSASILVGNVDRPYGMQWTVELRLRPASALLEERVTLYNRSDVRHRYYWWNNAAVRVWDDSKICYPMRWTASHGFTRVDEWPVDSTGRDLSVIGNQTRGTVSLFVHGSREPFMGIYHPHTQTGVAHYANFAELPAKKIWSWGVDADGLDWRRALSDDNSAYVEVQAGLMRNQETYAFLEPRQSIRFSEFWMPVRGIGGIARAAPAGVLNLRRDGGKLAAGFNANESFPGARIRLLEGARVVYEQTADLSPARTWSHEIDALPGKATFDLRSRDGRELMRQTEGSYDWSPESDIRTGPQRPDVPGGSLETGADEELNGDLLGAYEAYTRALDGSPSNLALRLAAGRLAAALLRYDEALRWLVPVQAHYTSHPEIAYYLGIAFEGLGRTREARAQFEAAYRMPAWRAAGGLKLAELAARAGNRAQAAQYLREVLRIAPHDLRAREELIELESPSARPPEMSILRSQAIASDAARLLGLADLLMRLGLWRNSLAMLSRTYPALPPEQREPGVPLPQNDPLVAYYRAYCRAQLREAAGADYEAASKMATAYVFPNGAQTLAVLEAAVAARPGDATAHYLLGNLRLQSGLVDQAVDEWQTARRIDGAIPVLDASLGRTFLRIRHDPRPALEVFRAGLAVDPQNAQVYAGIDEALSILEAPAAERVSALERYPDKAGMPARLIYELALSYAEDGRFKAAGALFQNRFFAREEGGVNVRQVWVRVRALEAAQAACPAALEILDGLGDAAPGLPFTRDGLAPFLAEAGNQPALGSVEARCGRAPAAVQRVETLLRRGDPASLAFAYLLARGLPGFDAGAWTARLNAAAQRAHGNAAAGAWPAMVWGLLQMELNRPAAEETLKSVILLDDNNLAHHHSRMIRQMDH